MKKVFIILILGLVFCIISCSDFLDEKPDIKMIIPKSLSDAELLLNDYSTLNMGYPLLGEWSSDEFYLSKESWEGLSNKDQRNAYLWIDEPYEDTEQWQRPYKAVYQANQVLEILSDLNEVEYSLIKDRIYGSAHFFRAFAFHQLVEVYAPAYEQHTANMELGIPLRLRSNIDVTVKRSNLKSCYEQIIRDYKTAIAYLPVQEDRKGQPHKAAAYGGLARTYLDMGMYENAYLYADSALGLKPELLDYNTLSVADNFPIPRFNIEVLFSAMSVNAGPMGASIGLVDSLLYQSYSDDDLRKTIFFIENKAVGDSYFYRGNYDRTAAQLFVGLTTSEMYLIKAESAIRTKRKTEAISALNSLLKNRWKFNTYMDYTEGSEEYLLEKILNERKKELVFRGRRWADLKRLNKEEKFRKTLIRNMGSEQAKLKWDDFRYSVRLPESVVKIGGLKQNKR